MSNALHVPGDAATARQLLAEALGILQTLGNHDLSISALEAVAVQSFQGNLPRAGHIIPILDARRGQIYCAFYRQTESRLKLDGDECVMSSEELFDEIRRRCANSAVVIAAAETQLISEALSRFENSESPSAGISIHLHHVSGVLAPWIGRLGISSAQRGQFSDALTLDANYVRRSDAELQLKGK